KMRPAAGASTPRRTWLPFTSRTRTVTASPTRITSPSLRVSTSIPVVPHPLSVDPEARLNEQLAEHLAQPTARDLRRLGPIGAGRQRRAKRAHALRPYHVERAEHRLDEGPGDQWADVL